MLQRPRRFVGGSAGKRAKGMGRNASLRLPSDLAPALSRHRPLAATSGRKIFETGGFTDRWFGTSMTREETVLSMIRQELRAEASDLTGYRVVLFGSRARGRASARSDFDIGVVGPRPLPLDVFYRLAERFEGLRSLYSVDWVDLQRTSEAFRQSAQAQAVTLHG